MYEHLNLIGVMQGRLLPKFRGQYQAHPLGYWEDEFYIAQRLGLNCIEFILDYYKSFENPLLSIEGVKLINSVVNKTGVRVETVCADYFMTAPLHSKNKIVANHSIKVMKRLVSMCSKLDVSSIVLPCVDESSLKSTDDIDRFLRAIDNIIDDFENNDIFLSLETDLAPKPFLNLLDKINSKKVAVNYDIGNSAALGFNPLEEISAYGSKISDVHIKDRMLGGGPVILGQGSADFETSIKKLSEINYSGPYIMQAYRDNEGLSIFKKQLEWFLVKREKINAC